MTPPTRVTPEELKGLVARVKEDVSEGWAPSGEDGLALCVAVEALQIDAERWRALCENGSRIDLGGWCTLTRTEGDSSAFGSALAMVIDKVLSAPATLPWPPCYEINNLGVPYPGKPQHAECNHNRCVKCDPELRAARASTPKNDPAND